MVLGEQSPGRVGRRPFLQEPRKGLFLYLGGAQLLAPAWVEVAQAAHSLADRRVRGEEGGEALVCERVRRVQRLGRRARLERDELHGLLQPDERIGEPVRRIADLRGEA